MLSYSFMYGEFSHYSCILYTLFHCFFSPLAFWHYFPILFSVTSWIHQACLSSLLWKSDPFPLTSYFLNPDHSQIIPTLMSSYNLKFNSSLPGHFDPCFQISSNIDGFSYKFHHLPLHLEWLLTLLHWLKKGKR